MDKMRLDAGVDASMPPPPSLINGQEPWWTRRPSPPESGCASRGPL